MEGRARFSFSAEALQWAEEQVRAHGVKRKWDPLPVDTTIRVKEEQEEEEQEDDRNDFATSKSEPVLLRVQIG